MPALSDAEVLTMEAVGEYLGFTQDLALYQYFRRHYTPFFPALGRVHRTTFTRQAANLWKVKELIWRRFLDLVQHDPAFALCVSVRLAKTPWSVRPSTAFESMSVVAGLG